MMYYRCTGCTTPAGYGTPDGTPVVRPTRLARFDGGRRTKCPKCGGWAEYRGLGPSGMFVDWRLPVRMNAKGPTRKWRPGRGRMGRYVPTPVADWTPEVEMWWMELYSRLWD